MTTSHSEVRIKVPLAEHFHSLQGEGRFTGLPMHFFRFPGCTVGKLQRQNAMTAEAMGKPHQLFTLLPNGAEAKVCTAFDGKEFFCDTDYAKHEEQDLALLIAETFERDVCFTGGEPLMHEKHMWYKSLYSAMRSEARVHVETSGTIVPKLQYDWLTVSPKHNWLPECVNLADQVKFLVDEHTRAEHIYPVLCNIKHGCIVYFSPIFDPNEFVPANFQACSALLEVFKNFRPQVSVQMHKFLGLR